jgi:bifunctional oligoribonuclease and PAP phosphatase NrnA
VTGRPVDLQDAARLIRQAESVLFFLHVNPDGDSIGSTLGMIRALRQAGKRAVAAGVDPVPRIYRYLHGWDEYFVPWQQVEGEWDLGCFLDCGDLTRVGDALPLVGRARVTLNVDHHMTNSLFGDYYYLDYKASAVGEMAFHLLTAMQLPIDRDAATCIYTSIVTDTGMFRYESVTPETHRIAAALLERGARPYDVAQEIYENETVPRLLLTARGLATLRREGPIAWIHVTRQMLQETGALDEDTEGLVNYPRTISGVEVGILFREVEGGIRVGLRSRGVVDVGAVAKEFGGGGHARAAGCTVAGDLTAAEASVIAALKAVLMR